MADLKISALPASTTPLAGTEVLPVVQSSTTKQVSVANLTAGRAVSASSLTASTGDITPTAGNVVIGTSGKGITDSTGAVKLNFSTAGTALSGAQSVYTGDFFNVGTAQTITITDTNGGYIVITGVQGGVGSSTWTLPFVKRSGSISIGTPSKAILTADPILSVAASSGNIVVTPLAANTYFTFAIYYTPLAL
jgi:hypothetical protein